MSLTPLPEPRPHVDLAAIGSADEVEVVGGIEALPVVFLKRLRHLTETAMR